MHSIPLKVHGSKPDSDDDTCKSMPLTPFHFGPGLLVRAVLGRHISLRVFCFAQVFADTEVAVSLVTGAYPVHRFFHTYAGAAAVAAVAAAAGRPACLWLTRWWNANLTPALRPNLTLEENVTWPAAVVGASAGSFTHVLVDSLMHPDMEPLAPFASGNALLGGLSEVAVYLLCVAMGALGAAWLAARRKSH